MAVPSPPDPDFPEKVLDDEREERALGPKNRKRKEFLLEDKELAFEVYWRLGSLRTLDKTAEVLKKDYGMIIDKRTLSRWASIYKWKARIKEREEEILREVNRRLAKRIVDDLEEYYDQMRAIMIEKGSNVEPKTMKDWRDFIWTILKMMSGGEERVQVSSVPNVEIVIKKPSALELEAEKEEEEEDAN